ncbi:MAG: zinc ribbon domain-containing protein [Acidobacteria bacterium]|nr:zinc ribbon domain-containing protein [Acidobacteriota bacterium]
MKNNNLLEPEITLTANCHNCGEIVTYGQVKCPYCDILLDQEEIFPSVVKNFVITQAVSAANNLRSFDVAVLIFLVVSVYISFFTELLWLHIVFSIVWLIPLLLIGGWFAKHGKWVTPDPDYEFSKKEMRAGLKLWLGAHFFNGVIIYIGWMKLKGQTA